MPKITIGNTTVSVIFNAHRRWRKGSIHDISYNFLKLRPDIMPEHMIPKRGIEYIELLKVFDLLSQHNLLGQALTYTDLTQDTVALDNKGSCSIIAFGTLLRGDNGSFYFPVYRNGVVSLVVSGKPIIGFGIYTRTP